MTTARLGSMAAICVIAATLTTSLVRGQAQGNGPSGPGQGKPGKTPGTVSIIPVDPGRPWGWAVKAFMEDPDRQLYNTTQRKMLDGKQVFSQTITKLDSSRPPSMMVPSAGKTRISSSCAVRRNGKLRFRAKRTRLTIDPAT